MTHLLQYFPQLSLRPENLPELRSLILQLAVEGKLTAEWRKENPDVEPAAELLARIVAEKAELVKAKKIKKSKPLPPVSAEEAPSKLPASWVWTRLDNLSIYIQRGKSPKYVQISDVPIVSQKCVQWDGFDLSKARFLNEEVLDKYQPERFLQEGDLLWNSTGNGTVGRTNLFPKVSYSKVVADSHVTVVRVFKEKVLPEYLWIYTASPYVQRQIEDRVSGSTKQTELNTSTVKEFEFPLPPLPEQQAIVQTVDALLQELDQLQQRTQARLQLKADYATAALRRLTTAPAVGPAWEALSPHFRTFFNEAGNVQALRAAILQLAVQGKLTAQWRKAHPDVEPATELLSRIQAEKAALVKAKKIKKEKPLPPVDAAEVPFAVPEGWVWCRMGNLCQYITDGTHQTPRYTENGRMFLSAKNVKPFSFLPEHHRFVSQEDFEGYRKNRKPELNDILLTRVGAGIGEAALIDQDLEFAIYVSVALLKTFKNLVYPEYFVIWLNSPDGRKHSSRNTYGKGVSQGNLNLSLIRRFAVSVPPLPEQHAIVQAVEELLGLCSALEDAAGRREQVLGEWVRAVVAGV
jgi:type I restriction enzyme S subunit